MAFLRKILVAGAGLLVVAGLAFAPASPVAAAPAAASAATLEHAALALPQSTSPTPDFWTGYVDSACSTCHIRYVNANFKVPTLNCADSNLGQTNPRLGAWMSIWAGLDGDGSGNNTLEQVGVQARCTSGMNSGSNGPTYWAFYEMVPDDYVTLPIAVSPGDSISVAVYYDQSSNNFFLTFDNNTTSTPGTIEAACPSGYTCEKKTAEVVVEVVGGGPPSYDMPDFGSVAFSGTTVTSLDGTKGDLCGSSTELWSDAKVQAVDNFESRGVTLATAGALSTCSGPDGFTATYAAGW